MKKSRYQSFYAFDFQYYQNIYPNLYVILIFQMLTFLCHMLHYVLEKYLYKQIFLKNLRKATD